VDVTKEEVLDVLRTVIDPELGIDIVSLGFVYDVFIESSKIKLRMTLSSPGCPLAAYLFSMIEESIKSKFKGHSVEIDLTFDPPWSVDKMTPEAKNKVGWHDES